MSIHKWTKPKYTKADDRRAGRELAFRRIFLKGMSDEMLLAIARLSHNVEASVPRDAPLTPSQQADLWLFGECEMESRDRAEREAPGTGYDGTIYLMTAKQKREVQARNRRCIREFLLREAAKLR
jgi:hypothetical protein